MSVQTEHAHLITVNHAPQLYTPLLHRPEDGRSETEITTIIAMVKHAFATRKELLTKCFYGKSKQLIVKAMLWSVAVYEVGAWGKMSCDNKWF